MRITRQLLLKIANDTVERSVRSHRNLLCVYLFGSVNSDQDPLLGGTADIDLGFIHDVAPAQHREVIRLTGDVHVDIIHQGRELYRQPRRLRTDPWRGSVLYSCKPLYDPRHFLDFVQASVRDLFVHPTNIIRRARTFSEAARQTWFDLQAYDGEPGRDEIRVYLGAVGNIANAIACLNGDPLPERRFLSRFGERAEMLARPGLYHGLLGLLGGSGVSAEDLRAWLPDWQRDFESAGAVQGAPIRLHPDRRDYYGKAISALLDSDQPMNALWPLLSTWTAAVEAQPEAAPVVEHWVGAIQQLGMWGVDFPERVAALDAFLDVVEETLEEWEREQGVG